MATGVRSAIIAYVDRVARVTLLIGLTLGLVGVAGAVVAGPPADEEQGVTQVTLRELVAQVASEHGLDEALVDAVIRVESGYDPLAVSHKGAQGLMQLMPGTARRLQVGDPFDAEENLRAGVKELSRLLDRFAGSFDLALAAYNAGEGAVQRYRGVPPYRETRNYITRIMTLYTGRPYSLPGSRRVAVPVRLVRDPESGQAVITNVGASAIRRQTDVVREQGRVLRGGFGDSSR